MQFPYLEVAKGSFAPVVKLELKTKDIWIECEAYVDSGASFSIFNIEIAEILEIDYKKGKKIYATVGDGGAIPIYLHNLKTRFSGKEFTATIGFSDKLGVDFNLLGRKSFFEKFRICFNDKDNILETTHLL